MKWPEIGMKCHFQKKVRMKTKFFLQIFPAMIFAGSAAASADCPAPYAIEISAASKAAANKIKPPMQDKKMLSNHGSTDMETKKSSQIFPAPQELRPMPQVGDFILPKQLPVSVTADVPESEIAGAFDLLRKELAKYGIELVRRDAPDTAFRMEIEPKYRTFHMPAEGLFLNVAADHIYFRGGAPSSMLRCSADLLQIMTKKNGNWCFPGCDFYDYPSLEIRGGSVALSPVECAELKLNAMMINADMSAPKLADLLTECAKYYLRPILCTESSDPEAPVWNSVPKTAAVDFAVFASFPDAPSLLELLSRIRNIHPNARLFVFPPEGSDGALRAAAPTLAKHTGELIIGIRGAGSEWAESKGGEAMRFWGNAGMQTVILASNDRKQILDETLLAHQATLQGFPCLGILADPRSDRAVSRELAGWSWRVPRRGENAYKDIRNLDKVGWKGLQSGWTDVKISTADKSREISARYELLQSPAMKILAVPHLVWMPDRNRLMLGCNSYYPDGEQTHFAMKMFSDDLGETWNEPEFLNGDAKPSMGASLTACYINGQLLSTPIIDGNIDFHYRSLDGGITWQKDSPVNPGNQMKRYCFWDRPLVSHGKIYETGYDDYCDATGKHCIQAYYRVSEDEGRTFGPNICPPEWKGINEVYLFQRKNGGFVAAGRFQNMAAELDQADSLVTSISADGIHWTMPVQVQPNGRMHPSIIELPDGTLVMTYVVREGYPDDAEGRPCFGIEAVESSDGGRSWNSEKPWILARFTGLYLKGKNRWASSVQSTSSVLLPDGNILTAFGTAHRAVFGPGGRQMPRDIGLIRWNPQKK